MKTKDECVAAHVDAGFALFPCGRGENGKAPWRKDWRDTKPDVTLAASDLPSMYGVNLPTNVVVLDYDPRRDPDYDFGNGAFDSQLSLLWQELKLTKADTFMVETAGGGYHLYFTKPAEVYTRGRIKGLTREYDAIDFKSFGGYTIGAGAITPDGKRYSVLCGSLQNLQELADPILACLRFIPGERTPETDSEFTDAASREQYVRFCKTRNGQDTAYVTACYGRDIGLSPQIILEVMLEVCNPLWQEPADEEVLKEKIEHVFDYAQNAQGEKNVVSRFTEASSNAAPLPKQKQPRVQPDKAEGRLPGLLPDSSAVGADYGSAGKLTFIYNKAGEKYLPATLTNTLTYLRLQHDGRDTFNHCEGLFRYNKFSQVIELTRKAPWQNLDPYEDFENSPYAVLSDYDVVKVQEDLANRSEPLLVGKEMIRDAIMIVAHENEYHPIRDWLKDLKWDKVPRLDTWLIDCCSSPDTPYVREIAKNTLIASVARVMQPGCKHDHMLILENSEQGTQKSEVVKVLGGKYAADIHIDLSNGKAITDTTAGMVGTWFLEASELEFMRRTDVGALKRFLSMSTDKVRLPYAHYHVTLPRQSVFIGTINPTDHGYLQDTTGNRRFWAVQTGRIDISKLRHEREQLFAEAYHRYMGREPWWIIDPSIEAIAKNEQNSRMTQDAWVEIISHWLKTSKLPATLTLENVAYYALNLPPRQIGRGEQIRVADALKKLGYERRQVRQDGKKVWAWEAECPV